MLTATFWLISSKTLMKTENRNPSKTLIIFQGFPPIQKVSPIPEYLAKNS